MGSANRFKTTGGVPGKPPCPEGAHCVQWTVSDVCWQRNQNGNIQPRGARIVTREKVINPGTGIYHASASKLNPDGTTTTDVYIIKDNKWQKAATSNDGGKTYTFDDDVAGAGLKKNLAILKELFIKMLMQI